jgi:ubiquinone/menaquinone biosynthesis C-methylase UbiE
MVDPAYIHTFTAEEQDRLVRQAELLEHHLHEHIDFSGCSRLLEIGCGVGAQLRILMRRHPHLHATGVDISEKQVQRARHLLERERLAGQVELHTCAGHQTPSADGSFDAVYMCFLLEIFSDPFVVLQEAKRVLTNGGVLYCTEVFNDALYVYPRSPAILTYWRAFNEYQHRLGGDPNIGIRLCNVVIEAGFRVKWLKDASYMLDRRMTDPKTRAAYFDHWYANFISAKDALLTEGAIDASLTSEFDREFDRLRTSDESVFLYSNRQVCACS